MKSNLWIFDIIIVKIKISSYYIAPDSINKLPAFYSFVCAYICIYIFFRQKYKSLWEGKNDHYKIDAICFREQESLSPQFYTQCHHLFFWWLIFVSFSHLEYNFKYRNKWRLFWEVTRVITWPINFLLERNKILFRSIVLT